jgi:hypothetical protein
MNGGLLVQHQNNPSYMHEIKTYDGHTLDISSTHHQAAFPYNLPKDKYKILGWTDNMLPFHEGGNREEMNPEKECEIVYYPKGNCLGIQGHPEALDLKHPTIAYLRDLLNKFLSNQLIESFYEHTDTKKVQTADTV